MLLLIINFQIFIFESKETKEKDNELFKKLRKLINLIDQLRDCGVEEYINLPRICSLGIQSSGKSSVIESIVGLDFLPRGEGVVTRRPLELRLNHINSGEPYAIFEEKKDMNFTDFSKIKKTIEELTDKECSSGKNISAKPIILKVYSSTCPDLTIIDLPGVTKVPVGNQPTNIEDITKSIAKTYIEDPLTIILCVISANSDISTSDGLKLAKEIDENGTRTLGVLTKLDIMDEGTNAQKTLLNKEIKLKLGYIAVKNRSKKDLDNKIPMEEALKKEKEFFETHKIYKRMPIEYFGTEALIKRLTEIYFKIIRENLPKIINAINERLLIVKQKLNDLGEPLPEEDSGKIAILWNLLNNYTEIFKKVLKDEHHNYKKKFLEDEGGFKIKQIFRNLLINFTGEYKATQNYSNEYINEALIRCEGKSIPGFPSFGAFLYLINPQLEKLRGPINESFKQVFQYLEIISRKLLGKIFSKFPKILYFISDLLDNYLNEEKNKAKYIIDSIIDSEINYMFTNDNSFINLPLTTTCINYNRECYYDKEDEIRNRIEHYFKIVVRNLRDTIPKIMGNFLINEIEKNMLKKLYNRILENKEINELFIESEYIEKNRKELNQMIKILKESQSIIKKDIELIREIYSNE